MRYHYLRTALLASLLCTEAMAASARTDIDSATSWMDSPPTSDRDDGTASPNLATIDDEDRAILTINDFTQNVLFFDRINLTAVRSFGNRLDRLVRKGMTPSQYFKHLVFSSWSRKNLLKNKIWRQWAFFISKYAKFNGLDAHECIAEAMAAEYSTGELINYIEAAAVDSETRMLAIRLRNYIWKDKNLTPDGLLKEMKISSTVKNLFEHPRFAIYAAYVRFTWKELSSFDQYGKEVADLLEVYEAAAVIKFLISSDNVETARGKAYLEKLNMVWLDKKMSPSEVGQLLVRDVNSNIFSHLESNIQVLVIWERYLSLYNSVEEDYQLTLIQSLTSTIGPARSAMMLHAAVNAPHEEVRMLGLSSVEDQCREWLYDKKTPEDVSMLLSDSVGVMSVHEYSLLKVATEWIENEYDRYHRSVHAPIVPQE